MLDFCFIIANGMDHVRFSSWFNFCYVYFFSWNFAMYVVLGVRMCDDCRRKNNMDRCLWMTVNRRWNCRNVGSNCGWDMGIQAPFRERIIAAKRGKEQAMVVNELCWQRSQIANHTPTRKYERNGKKDNYTHENEGNHDN